MSHHDESITKLQPIPTLQEVLERPNLALSHYLMSCYLYYMRHQSVYTDEEFDLIAKKLLEVWDEVEHPHKDLVSLEDLEAGTGYSIKYTQFIEHAADMWLRQHKGTM